jgi:type II secretory pathway pseudopilin PulG
MNNQKGVTLVALVVTITVLLILLSITLSYGIDTLTTARENNTKSEVEIVAQAVAEQYTKIVEMGYDQLKVTDVSNPPAIFIGKKTAKTDASIPDIMKKDLADDAVYVKSYYGLTESDLLLMKIKAYTQPERQRNPNDIVYIVNYYTGEVLNVEKSDYYVGLRNGTDGHSTVQSTEQSTVKLNDF